MSSDLLIPLVAFILGLAGMYVAIYMMPFLLPQSFYGSIEKAKREKARLEEAEREAQRRKMKVKTTAIGAESYRVSITQNDVDRGVTIMISEHVKDQIEDLKKHGKIKHLLQLVFMSWNREETPLWRHEDLVRHLQMVYAECPALPYFLTENSIVPFFELFYTGEKGMPDESEEHAPLDTYHTFHERFVKESHDFFESLGKEEHKERLDAIADECVLRMERTMKAAWAARGIDPTTRVIESFGSAEIADIEAADAASEKEATAQ